MWKWMTTKGKKEKETILETKTTKTTLIVLSILFFICASSIPNQNIPAKIITYIVWTEQIQKKQILVRQTLYNNEVV